MIESPLILAAIYLLGYLFVRTILKRSDWLIAISLSLGLGGGLLTWVLFLLSWAGLPFTSLTIILSYLGLVIIFGIGVFWTGRVPAEGSKPQSGLPDFRPVQLWLARGAWAIIGILILSTTILAVGLSYYSWDAIANWSVKGYGMALEGSIFAGAKWGSVGLSYPFNQTMLIGIFRIFGGDSLPGSKLMFPLFYISLLLGCYRFWRKRKVHHLEASLGALLLASTPIMFNHATIGYSNLSFTLYLCLGLLWIIEGGLDEDKRKGFLGSILLAFSIWTRPEGLLTCIGVFVALLGAQILFKRKSRDILWLVVTPLIVASSWLLFSRMYGTGDAEAYDLSRLAINGLLRGDIRWDAMIVILRFIAGQVLRFRDWGMTLVLVGIMYLVGLRPRHLRQDITKTTLAVSILVLALIVIGAHYMAAYSPRGPDWVYEWLSLNYTRLFMPVGTLMIVLAFLTLGSGSQIKSGPRLQDS